MLQQTSSRRLRHLEQLVDFLEAATRELLWLGEREETEVNRDWSSRALNMQDIRQHYEVRGDGVGCWEGRVRERERGR